ncbi:MAG: amidohydrolase family protein [Acidobacteriota bacterium]
MSFPRQRSRLKPIRFPLRGVELPARGHMGLSLSPDGKRIATIALGKLWVFPIGSQPNSVAPMPQDAAGLSWSPDGREIAWSAGPGGAEDLFATDVETGKTRRLTALPGREVRPSWSPDGQRIAFLHWQKPALTTPPWEWKDSGLRLSVIPAHSEPVERLDTTMNITDLPPGSGWAFSFFGHGQEVPQWSPDSKALLLFETKATLVPLKGEPRQLQHFPANLTFLHWGTDSSIVYVKNDMLWRAPFSSDSGMVGEPTAVSNDPALYPSVARDGSILYISEDGLRVRRPDGRVERLGWPLTYRTPAAPERLLLRGVRIIDGKGTPPSAPRDILVEDGRIARIAPTGKLKAKAGTRVVEAEGRTVIPGLIDLHTHLWDDAQLPGLLYYGVTTVRDMGTAIGRLAGLRDAIEAGVRPGPRIVFGGFQFWGATGFSGETGQAPADEAGRARAVALLRAFGADYLKMRQFTGWDAGAKLIEHAHASGMPVSGHIALPLPLMAAGIDGMEHLGPSGTRTNEILYDDIIQLFKAAQLWIVPTIVAYSSEVRLIDEPSIIDQPDTAPFLTPFLRWWALARHRPPTGDRRLSYERFAHLTRLGTEKLHKAGITIAAGADVSPLPWALHLELEELVNAGLSSMEAINAATSVAARVLGSSEEIGSIKQGKLADLVILDADPLHDIRHTRKIWRVIKGGWVFDPEKLRPRESAGATK